VKKKTYKMTTYPTVIIEAKKEAIRKWTAIQFEGYLLTPVGRRTLAEWIAYNEVFAEKLHARMLTNERDNVRYDWSLLTRSVAELFEATTRLAHGTPLHEGD
jgi:hypothetical protein